MSDQPVKDLTEKAVPQNGDDFLIEDNTANVTKKIGYDNLKTALNADLNFSAKANLAGGNNFTGTQSLGDGAIERFNAQVVTISSFPYTLLQSDNGKVLRFNSGSNADVNLPNNLPAGFNVAWSQAGTGVITFAPIAGATRVNRQSHTKSGGQHAMGSLVVMTNSGTDAMYNLAGDTQA
jgi:hypothetical protein